MRRTVSLTAFFALTVLAIAHDDDPKARQTIRPWLAPGWSPAAALETSGGALAPPYEAQGVALLSFVSIGDLGLTLGANDCWGYVSPSGREYALLGTEEATAFIEVTDPQAPQIVGTIPGPVGVWRDVKVYGEYAYSVHEVDGVGIQVIDLSQIDAGQVTLVNTVEGTDTGYTHNVAINEESGFLYRTGGSYHGLRMYDLADPANPQYAGSWDTRYVHDAQVVTWADGREIAFCCSGFNSGWTDTGLSVVDVSDKQNPIVLAQLTLPGGVYSHQGWLSEDRQLFYLGDELDENGSIDTTTHVFDVAVPEATSYIGTFSNSSKAVGHNMYTHDGKLYQANYRSGLRVFDVGVDPLSPPEVAWFDTQPTSDASDYGGTWSNYPYLPSGVVLLSDRGLGLFVLRVDDSLGTRRCSPAPANSTGQSAWLEAIGSPFVAENRVTLRASDLPPGETAFVLASPGGGGAVLPGGARSGVCVGAPFGADHAGAQTVDGGGTASFALDLLALPSWQGPVAALAGETWFFQVVSGDTAGAAFTDALAVRLR